LASDTQIPEHPQRVIRQLQLPSKNPRTLKFVMTLLKKKAESLSRLSSYDRTPKILGYFEEDNNFYLVEEFIAGQSLEAEVVAGHPLPENGAIHLLQEILEILVMVHGWGLVHRSIKPSALIRRQADANLMLTGFGIFKEISAQVTRSPGDNFENHSNGASTYISPEQIQGQVQFSQVQFNTDIYAVGVIGIQSVTGLSTPELAERLHIAQEDPSVFPWQEDAQVSSELIAILSRMVHLDTKQRYQLASEVLDDLRRLKAARAITPLQPLNSNHQVHQQWFRLSTARLVVPSVVGLVLLAAAGLWYIQMPQALLAHYFLQRGKDQIQQKQPDQAIASYTRAIQTRPAAATFYNRGLAFLELGNQHAALEDLTQAIQRDPKLVQAYYQRGKLRSELGDRQGAMADYTQSLRLDPNLISAYVNRGNVRAELQDEQGAIKDYTMAIEQDPNLAAAYLNRCLSRSNLDDHNGAIADCTQAINLQPNSVLSYQNRGLVRRRLGDKTGAIEDFNIAIRLNPNDPDPYYNRGVARMELGDIAGAIADYTTAIKRDPSHVFAYYDRGLAYVETGDTEQAILDFQQSATFCLDLGRMDCYQDAQYQLKQLRQQTSETSSNQ
jgi:serine/threonine-protein kinase